MPCSAQRCIMQAAERRHGERKCITKCWAQGFGSQPSIHSYMCTHTHTLSWGHTDFSSSTAVSSSSSSSSSSHSLSFCYVSSSAVGQAWLGQGCVTESTTHFSGPVCDRMFVVGVIQCVCVSALQGKKKQHWELTPCFLYFYLSFALGCCLEGLQPLLFLLSSVLCSFPTYACAYTYCVLPPSSRVMC